MTLHHYNSVYIYIYIPEKVGGEAVDGDRAMCHLCALFECRYSDVEFKGCELPKVTAHNLNTFCKIYSQSIQHLVIFVHVHYATCAVPMDALDPDAFTRVQGSDVLVHRGRTAGGDQACP